MNSVSRQISRFYSRLSLVLLWLLLITYLMLAPLSTLPSVEIPSPYSLAVDKLVHLLMFGVLSGLLWLLIKTVSNKKYVSFGLSFLISSGYAYVIEYWQSFTATRTYSLWDLFFGMLGAALVLTSIFFSNKKI